MRLASVLTLATAVALPLAASCSGGDKDRSPGQTSFISAPFPNGGAGDTNAPGAGEGGAGAGSGGGGAAPASGRQVEETDLYRLDGTRLYYLNAYRGLMVFDVTNADAPKLLGRSPIFGSPVDMIVHKGIATVVVGDWYGRNPDGSPFYGSIVRGLDATDPTNIKVLGDAHLGGWVSDDRVVGNVLYAVSEDYGWYGLRLVAYGLAAATTAARAAASPARAARGSAPAAPRAATPTTASRDRVVRQLRERPGHSGRQGRVRRLQRRLQRDAELDPARARRPTTARTASRARLRRHHRPERRDRPARHGQRRRHVQGWGADNGRWNLDFADGITAHAIGMPYDNNSGQDGYVLSTVDFTNPDAPALDSELVDRPRRAGRSPRASTAAASTSRRPTAVRRHRHDAVPGLRSHEPAGADARRHRDDPRQRVELLPAPNAPLRARQRLQRPTATRCRAAVLRRRPTRRTRRSSATQSFGDGWAWTPAAGTFKAFTMDTTQGLVVLPFSGWDYNSSAYNNGVQLIQFTDTSETIAGAAHTKGWVERGIFVGNAPRFADGHVALGRRLHRSDEPVGRHRDHARAQRRSPRSRRQPSPSSRATGGRTT